MKILHNIIVPYEPVNILADIYYKEEHQGKLIVFCHGFKGFKDWGAWHLVAGAFAEAGFIFVKFNFSHNGLAEENTSEFTRLDLFRANNYSQEMADTERLIHWLYTSEFKTSTKLSFSELSILGHSRGGGIALLTAFENQRIAKVVTWASIANFDRFGTEDNIANWKAAGEKNFYNSRTKQDMKIAYQFYEDFDKNRKRFDLENACKAFAKPHLIIHGKGDESVGFSHAQRLKAWNPSAELFLIEEANHVFGAKHPYLENDLPKALQQAVKKSIEFLNS